MSMMLHIGWTTKDNDAVNDISFEGAVHPVQQTEVLPKRQVSSPRCQQLHGMCHPIRAMAVMRQNTRTTFGDSRRGATELNAFCDEHNAHHGSTRACNPSCTEQEEVVESPRGPSTVRRSQNGTRTDGISSANQRHQTTTGRTRSPTRACSDQALQKTRGTTSATSSLVWAYCAGAIRCCPATGDRPSAVG